MERERAAYLARTLGNWLLVTAAVVLVLGLLAIWRIAAQVDDRLGFGDPGDSADIDDYAIVITSYALGLVTAVGIVGGFGLYFRWLAFEQEARMAEYDLLLDVIEGVEPEDGEGDNVLNADSDTR